MMPTLQEQLAARGIQMPMAPTPDAVPPVLNMPVQTIGPQGMQAQMSAPAPRPIAPMGPAGNVDLSGMNNPAAPGALDLGLLKKHGSDAFMPETNVDLSGMKSEQRVGYKPSSAPAPSLRAALAGSGGAKAINPFANEEAAIARAREGEKSTLGLHQELGEQGFLQADQRAKEANDFQVETGERSARHQDEAKAWEQQYGKELDTYKNDRIDSQRFINSRSTGEKMIGFVQNILGGFAEGFSGGAVKNPYQARLDEAIRRDIDEQRANHEAKGEGLKGKQQLYSMMLGRFKDEDAAADATHALYLDRIRAEGERQAALSQNAEVQDRWQKADAALDMQSAALKDRAAQALIKGPPATNKADLKEASDLAKRREEAGIPAFETNIDQVNQIIARNGGEIPGTSLMSRVAKHIPGGEALRGTDARQMEGAVTSIAEAMAHANGQRGTEAIELNKHIIMGNGSADDVRAGLERAKAVIAARGQNIQSGFDPRVVGLREQLAGMNAPAPAPVAVAPPPSFRAAQ